MGGRMLTIHNKLSTARKKLKKLEAKLNGMTDQIPADEKDRVTKRVEATKQEIKELVSQGLLCLFMMLSSHDSKDHTTLHVSATLQC